MAEEQKALDTEAQVERSVARSLGTGLLALILLGLLGVGVYFGAYTLRPGQAAILLRFGQHWKTVSTEGLHFTLPPPFVLRRVVNVGELRNEDFGVVAGARRDEVEAAGETGLEDAVNEATMQTSDNNIVHVSFAVQYRIADPYLALYRVADLGSVVRSAAAAAMRQVAGRMSVDAVLREERAALTADTAVLLQEVLEGYDAGIEIQSVEAPGPSRPPDAGAWTPSRTCCAANQNAVQVP